jgi:ABC-2 type transport system ATP-binding protein
MIEVNDLSKRYGRVAAVRGITFNINRGEIVGFLGPNGAGKTTTMRMLTTFLPPSDGTARVAGFDILKQSDEVRKNIGYLPETPPLYPELTVKEYLSFVAELKGVAYGEVKRAVGSVIERCRLVDVTDRLCGELSKGYRQRVGLAQALVNTPPVLILDEPTSGLDPSQIIEIRKLIRELAEKHTVILSTHILPEVSEICSRVVIIARGKIIVEGEIAKLTAEKSLEEKYLEAVSSD